MEVSNGGISMATEGLVCIAPVIAKHASQPNMLFGDHDAYQPLSSHANSSRVSAIINLHRGASTFKLLSSDLHKDLEDLDE